MPAPELSRSAPRVLRCGCARSAAAAGAACRVACGYLPADRLAPRVISPQNAWLMTNIMKDVVMRGTARRARALGRDDLAGKTGTPTTSATPGSTVSTANWSRRVWVGFDDERSLGSGEEGARCGRADLDAFHARGAARRAVRHAGRARWAHRPEGLPLHGNACRSAWIRMRSTRRSCSQHQPRVPEPGDPGVIGRLAAGGRWQRSARILYSR